MRIYVAHSGSFDFEKELYNPLERSFGKEHSFFFPETEKNKKINTKELIKEQIDLMIAEISFPATGLGIELGRAEDSGIPILCIYKKGSKFSNSIKFITNNLLEYEDEEDLIQQISKFLESYQKLTAKL